MPDPTRVDPDDDRDSREPVEPAEPDALSEALIEPLRQARPWVGFLATGTFAAAVYAVALGVTELTGQDHVPDREHLAWGVLGVVAIFPAIALMRATRAIDRVLDDQHPDDLADTLRHLSAFISIVAVTGATLLALYGLSALAPRIWPR